MHHEQHKYVIVFMHVFYISFIKNKDSSVFLFIIFIY